ncbi:DUF7266 family protein [Halorhabdus tiamatea]|uniref:Uncharacterized protein n=1 Tax=Halorhabdus tiamatea SARL4B TaxID=1033806 RepID=S6D9A5_9EURY|nr:hypothetical protein [Halorhabdus tiamatea]CCQ34871.1 conserved hypothetical protein [Halorhabdus tiamatea SARL4B]
MSVAITHGLTIAITGVLLIGLLNASGALLDSQEERISHDQVSEINGDILSHINTVDRLAANGEAASLNVTLSYPDRIMGSYNYQVDLRGNGDPAVLEVRVPRLDQSITRELETKAGIDPAQDSGPEITISLCDGSITLGGCS